MTVTRITGQIKNPNRVSIYVDGIYSFSLNLNQLLDSKLKVGTELEDTDITYYEKLSADGKLKIRTMEWLTIRPRSAKELNDYLKRKSVDEEELPSWIADMQKRQYQNDEQFARWWVEQRRSKQKSERFIVAELRSKGISQDIIHEVMADSGATDKDSLQTLVIKKRRQSKYQDDKKLTEYLARQGFSYSLIKDVLAGTE